MEMQSLSRHLAHSKEKDGQKKKRFSMNPLQQGIRQFLHENQPRQQHLSTSPTFVSGLPKRFTFYPPMLLLSANVFSTPDDWAACYSSLSETDRQNLYASIAEAFTKSGQTVTHIAINAPIQLTTACGHENHMRSPNGLTPLYGDFGELLDVQHSPSRQDLDQAFWVHSTQNGGIVQYWAPLYTMFSRGNITEKARILGLQGRFTGLDESSLSPQTIDDISVVDLYAGIGYFVFSYLKRGVRRVWGWELNAWSVEGLRRGCLENGWQCKVVRLSRSESHGALPSILEDQDLAELLNELTDDTRVVIFQGDNQSAPEILKKLQPELERRGLWTAIRHVNLGLLPSSQQTWKASLQLLDRNNGGWAHVHENVDVSEIETKAKYIEAEYSRLAGHLDGVDTNNLSVACDHVEKVKTYAPGVMHCVFDIQVKFEKS